MDPVIVRRSGRGWRVGSEETSDLISAMVLADLMAAELPAPPEPRDPSPDGSPDGQDAARLAVTVAQLTRALAARVRVEQAIGVLAERHRLRPRQAFDLLRTVARSRGQKISEIAESVVDSASNSLLLLPNELSRPVVPRRRGPSPRRARAWHKQ